VEGLFILRIRIDLHHCIEREIQFDYRVGNGTRGVSRSIFDLTVLADRRTLAWSSVAHAATRKNKNRGEDMTPPGQFHRDDRRGIVRVAA